MCVSGVARPSTPCAAPAPAAAAAALEAAEFEEPAADADFFRLSFSRWEDSSSFLACLASARAS